MIKGQSKDTFALKKRAFHPQISSFLNRMTKGFDMDMMTAMILTDL